VSISRRIAGGLLALTTLGIGALAEPASAQPPVDGHGAPQDPVQSQTTESPEQKRAREEATQELRQAIGRAKNLVHPDSPCRDYFGTSTQAYAGQQAVAVLQNIEADENFVNKYDTPGPTTKTGPALAKYSLSTGEITFYKDFFDKSANGTLERDGKSFVPPLTPEQVQTLTVLHELAHAFGKDHNDTTDADAPRKFDDALAKACFNSSLPPPPPPPPGNGGVVNNDATIGSPSYYPPVPQYVFVEPLPEGYTDVRVVIPDDPEIIPDDPDPLPDDYDPDDPCDLDPYGCGGGGGYDPFAAELMY
jgi:hypothetical protein